MSLCSISSIENSILQEIPEKYCPNTPTFSKYFTDHVNQKINVCDKKSMEKEISCHEKRIINFYSKWEKCFSNKLEGYEHDQTISNLTVIELKNQVYADLKNTYPECSIGLNPTLKILGWTHAEKSLFEVDYWQNILYRQVMVYPISKYKPSPGGPYDFSNNTSNDTNPTSNWSLAHQACHDILPGISKLAAFFTKEAERNALEEADQECKKYGNKMGCRVIFKGDPNYILKDGEILPIEPDQPFYGRVLCRIKCCAYGSKINGNCPGPELEQTESTESTTKITIKMAKNTDDYLIQNKLNVLAYSSHYQAFYEALTYEVSDESASAVWQDLSGNSMINYHLVKNLNPSYIAKNVIPRPEDISLNQRALFRVKETIENFWEEYWVDPDLTGYNSTVWLVTVISSWGINSDGNFLYNSADGRFQNYGIEDIRLLWGDFLA